MGQHDTVISSASFNDMPPYGGPFDCFRCGRIADVPTGEFWLGAACGVTPRLAASIAHLGGRAIAAAAAWMAGFSALVGLRVWRGPTTADRVVGLDAKIPD